MTQMGQGEGEGGYGRWLGDIMEDGADNLAKRER